MKKDSIITALLFLGICISTTGQVAPDSELYATLKQKDSILFDAAFNKCYVETMEALFTEDFEFYHDKGGLTQGREVFLSNSRVNCANRKVGEPQPAKRFLVDGSVEVFPLFKNGKLYGAIQHGVHTFEFLNENKEYQKGDIAKFTHLWILEGDEWKIKRELSYDHQLQQ